MYFSQSKLVVVSRSLQSAEIEAFVKANNTKRHLPIGSCTQYEVQKNNLLSFGMNSSFKNVEHLPMPQFKFGCGRASPP